MRSAKEQAGATVKLVIKMIPLRRQNHLGAIEIPKLQLSAVTIKRKVVIVCTDNDDNPMLVITSRTPAGGSPSWKLRDRT